MSSPLGDNYWRVFTVFVSVLVYSMGFAHLGDMVYISVCHRVNTAGKTTLLTNIDRASSSSPSRIRLDCDGGTALMFSSILLKEQPIQCHLFQNNVQRLYEGSFRFVIDSLKSRTWPRKHPQTRIRLTFDFTVTPYTLPLRSIKWGNINSVTLFSEVYTIGSTVGSERASVYTKNEGWMV